MDITHNRVLYFLLTIVLCLLYITVSYIRTNDASFQTVVNTKEVPGHVWLISYADGPDAHYSNQSALVQSAVNKGIDAIRMYNKKDLDQDFLTKNASMLTDNWGAGYWIWKPYIILKTLESVPENDVVLYFDAGIKIIKDLTPIINLTQQKDIVLFENIVKNHRYIKRDAMVYMDMDDVKYLDEYGIHASMAFFKNTKQSRDFVKSWLKYCEDPRIVTDAPSINKEFADFQVNFHDQTVLTLLHLKNPHKQFVYKYADMQGEYIDRHRRRTQDTLAASLGWQNYVISMLERPDAFTAKMIDFLQANLIGYY